MRYLNITPNPSLKKHLVIHFLDQIPTPQKLYDLMWCFHPHIPPWKRYIQHAAGKRVC